MSIRKADEYERLKALHYLLSDLDRAKRRAKTEGWIEEDEIDKVNFMPGVCYGKV